MSIQKKLSRFPVSDSIWNEYHLDQNINDRGIGVDMFLVENAIVIDEMVKKSLVNDIQSLTNLDNPNSVQQMKNWLSENGFETESLSKSSISEMLKTAPYQVHKVLSLRQQLAKSSVKKYTAMKNAVCKDSRARGIFQFYGANRTGRFSGRLVQLQNLPQNHMSDLADARSLVKCGNYDALSILYDDIPDTLSQLIRTAFIPQHSCKFIVADFSAIEARVLAWLAGEKWRNKVFSEGKDIYCSSASQMFGVPVEKHGINGHLRQKGKIAELALGYGGSVGALKAMGAIQMGHFQRMNFNLLCVRGETLIRQLLNSGGTLINVLKKLLPKGYRLKPTAYLLPTKADFCSSLSPPAEDLHMLSRESE